MKRLLLLLGLFISAFCCEAQIHGQLRAKEMYMDSAFILRRQRADSLQLDTIGWLNDVKSIPVADAIYRFVEGRVNGFTSYTDADAIAAVQPIIDDTAAEIRNYFTLASAKPELLSLYKMPSGNITNEFDGMTESGAMATATKTIVNGFDNIVVTGTDQNSYIRFPFILTHNRVIYKIKIRIDAVGATAPIVGFRNIWPGSTYSNFNNPQFYGYFNLATGAVTTTTAGTTTTSTYNGFTGTVVVGDIIDVELKFEYGRPRILKITKSNKLTGELSIINQLKNTNADGDWATITHPGIILADGSYTILDYEILSLDGAPKILIDGDSMGIGVRISYSDMLVGKLLARIPYRVACMAAGTKKTAGHVATLWQLSKLRPEYVVLFNYLDACQGDANPASGNYATWTANFTRYVSTIKSLGVTPIFVYPETWAVIDPSGTNSAYYETYLNTNYPSDLKIKVLTSQSFYDATGFHYNGVTNEWIANEIISLTGL